MKISSILMFGLTTFFLGTWITLASVSFSAKTLTTTPIYQDISAQNIVAQMPPSTRLDIIHCFDTGSDFFYAVKSDTGAEGYVYELSMNYKRSWHMPSFRKLFSNPIANISCLTMTKNWDVN
ncbi:hypothetical protein [Xanthomonas tesorieronis]|uniref:hypothetical protein n=1 Tax=Xanthomonas tesorieronis TaxID=3160839 RepID=UPI003519AC30